MKMLLEILRPAEVKRSGNIAYKFKSSFGVLPQSFCAQANTEVPEKVYSFIFLKSKNNLFAYTDNYIFVFTN